MRRGTRISLIILGIALLIAAVAVCSAYYVISNHLITRKVNKVLKEHLVQLRERGIEASYDTAYVSMMSGNLHICNVKFRSDTVELNGSQNGIEASLAELELELKDTRILKMLKSKNMEASELILDNPNVTVFIGADEPILKKKIVVETPIEDSKASLKKTLMSILKKMDMKKILEQAGINNIRLENGSVQLKNVTNKMSLNVDQLNFEAHDFSYSIIDSTMHYNDSIYDLKLDGVDFTVPDGKFRITLGELSTSDAGDVVLQKLKVSGLMPKDTQPEKKGKQVLKKGKQPATRIDISVPELRTTPVNIVRLISSESVYLGGVKAKIDKLLICGKDTTDLTGSNNGVKASLAELKLSGIKYNGKAKSKSLSVRELTLNRPSVTAHIGDDEPLFAPSKEKKFDIKQMLHNAGVKSVKLHNGSVKLKNVKNKLNLTINNLSFAAHDINYNLLNNKVRYNDSVYNIKIDGVDFTIPNGLYHITLDELSTSNAREVILRGMHARGATSNDRFGTWTDIEMPELKTTPINVFRTADSKTISVDGLKAKISRILLCGADTTALTGKNNGIEASLGELELKDIKYSKEAKNKQLDIRELILDKPSLTAYIGAEGSKQKTNRSAPKAKKADAKQMLQKAGIKTVRLQNGSVKLKNITNSMDLTVESMSAAAHDLSYNFSNGKLQYSDSEYDVKVNGVDFTVPTGLFRITLDELNTSNAGEIKLQGMHAWCPLPKDKLAEKKGNQPATWTDIDLSELRTTPVNIPKLINSKAVNIDGVNAKADKILIYRDIRFESSTPFPMPQEGLLKMNMPLNIAKMDISLDKFIVEVAMSTGRVGVIDMKDAQGTVKNITNRRGQTIKADMKVRMGDYCKGQVGFGMKINEDCDFDVDMLVTDFSGSDFDNFMRPLFGLTVACNISKLETRYSGNSTRADGDFLMLYNGMKVHAYKGEPPFKALSKAAGLLNAFGGVVIQPQNPRHKNKQALPVTVSHERNPMKNFAVYLFGPMISGMVQTVLPGAVLKTISKVVAKKKTAKENAQNAVIETQINTSENPTDTIYLEPIE